MNRNNAEQQRILNRNSVALILLCVFALLGVVCQWFYKQSPANAIPINDVRYAISVKQRKAEEKMKVIEGLLQRKSLDSLNLISFQKLANTYLVYRNGELIFWSNNITSQKNLQNTAWEYVLMPNMHTIAKSKKISEFNIVAYIPVKYNYSYENKELTNKYFEGFKLNKEIGIVLNKPADKYAIFSNQNDYLFTLKLPDQPVYNENWAIAAMYFFLAAFFLLFYLFATFPLLIGKKLFTWKEFLEVTSIMTLFVIICLKFNLPTTFFSNKIFTPYHYATNSILASLTHLSFLTSYICSTIYLFCFHTDRNLRKDKYFTLKAVVLLLIPGAYFMLIFNFMVGLVFNSTTELNILKLTDFNWVSVWNHFLLFFLGISYMSLYLKIHRIILRKKGLRGLLLIDIPVTLFFCVLLFFNLRPYGLDAAVSFLIPNIILYLPLLYRGLMDNKWFVAIWLFFITLFVTWNFINMNKDKKFEKYKTLAENHYLNDNADEDKIAELILVDIDREVKNDEVLRHLMQYPDSVQKANDYLNKAYLRGFWSKYEMRLFATLPGTVLDQTYQETINSYGNQIKSSNFFVMNSKSSDMAFLGAFKLEQSGGKKVNFYMEFYPKKYYKSYSFPGLLVEGTPSLQQQLELSSARYTYHELAFTSGKFRYPRDGKWIDKKPLNFYTQDYGSYRHYIYVPNIYNYFILSEENTNSIWGYLLYVLYTFVVYLLVAFLIFWIYKLIHKKTSNPFRLTSRYLYSFVVLLIISFVSIFYVSINYIQQKYRNEQRINLERTKNYIQTALQEKYYWTEKIDSSMENSLNLFLQDLSYTYQNDIHVYDNEGKLIASSQPSIFSRGLISKRISPLPFFSKNPNMNNYEYIGELEYLTAYTDFYNGDFLQIGYIAVPQYFSNDQIQAEIQEFLAVIVHIYLVITILLIFLSLVINKKLSEPLAMLERSLKDIRLGQRNKKIEYKPNDEIGQLVIQYNKTVDELEESARLLAKSERESAWKTMARQVAHEINNPLTPMKLTIQQLQRTKKMGDNRFDEYFEKSTVTLIEQIENLSQIAGTFSTFARLPEAKPDKVDVSKIVGMVVELFSNNHDGTRIIFRSDVRDAFVIADREQLIQVFNNLLKNAIQSIPTGREGKIQVSVETTPENVFVHIRDNGKGISDDIKDKLFTPNFTTKSTGMGLGLSISQNMIRMAGGQITFETKIDEGTVFHVILPKYMTEL